VAIIDPIKVEGLVDFQRSLRALDADLPKALRVAHNAAAQIVVDFARTRVPTRSGKAARSVRATSSQRDARVTGGGARVPYYPWLDFGGRVGRRHAIRRPFIKGGRYIYEGYTQRRGDVEQALTTALLDVCRQAGLEVD
jgi:hypothetical protein